MKESDIPAGQSEPPAIKVPGEPDPNAGNAASFLDDVFPTEQGHIRRRRKQLGLDDEKVQGEPNADQGLVGLALSGGGIRSATFGLGVIQGLARHGLLRHADYLSTVSGGGYIGSCLSALLNDPRNAPAGNRFPLRYTDTSAEPPALTHLRNSSNYLSPVGLLSKLRLPILMLRGILLNLFVFLPYIMAAVFLTEVAYEVGPNWDALPHLVPPLLGIFMFLAILFPYLIRTMRGVFNWRRRNGYELMLAVPMLLAVIVLVLIPILHITRLAIEHSTGQFLYLLQSMSPGDVWRFTVGLLAVTGLFMAAGKASENVGRVLGRVLLWLVGLLGPALVYGIFLALCLWQIDSPFLPAGSDRGLNDAVACEQPCLAGPGEAPAHHQDLADSHDNVFDLLFEREAGPASAAQLRNAMLARGVTLGDQAVIRCLSGNCAAEPADWRDDDRVWVINRDPARVGACPAWADEDARSAAVSADDCLYISRVSKDSFRIDGALDLFDGPADWWFLGTIIGLLLLNRFLLDINFTSPHGFYRDRLSKAFLFRVEPDGEVLPEDGLKLSELNREGSTAPYHLINVALNLQGSTAPDLRGRESDFFTFTHEWVGSTRSGYTRTEDMERYDHHLDLATAIAISGAAAAPNMGTTTNRALVFIMTLLNIRLGYWLPNPSAVNAKLWFKHFRLGAAKPTLIWKEALGRLDEKGTHVNVSDGGHIENLGIYQLLKRRCKFIVAVDGECDPEMQFGGLATLMRFARIDLGVDIHMDLDALRKGADGLSRSHWVLGEIRYADGSTGQLLYVKLSVTGQEPEYVRSYRSEHPEFPHEPTSDQFFTEAQFEAYRALGACACEGMLEDIDALGGFKTLADKPRDAAEDGLDFEPT